MRKFQFRVTIITNDVKFTKNFNSFELAEEFIRVYSTVDDTFYSACIEGLLGRKYVVVKTYSKFDINAKK